MCVAQAKLWARAQAECVTSSIVTFHRHGRESILSWIVVRARECLASQVKVPLTDL